MGAVTCDGVFRAANKFKIGTDDEGRGSNNNGFKMRARLLGVHWLKFL
jgi:hypothetical protein